MNQILSVPSQVGLVLRAARQNARLSQKALAARLGLSQNRLSELETDPGSMRVEQLLAGADPGRAAHRAHRGQPGPAGR